MIQKSNKIQNPDFSILRSLINIIIALIISIIICLTEQLKMGFDIIVKTLENKDFSLKVESSDLIETVRQRATSVHKLRPIERNVILLCCVPITIFYIILAYFIS